MDLGKYSLGIGDRFAHQGKPQLAAIKKAKAKGLNITPVWNKSYREHQIINSKPHDTRREADLSVKSLEWTDPYFVDADHIGIKSVDYFIDSSDFFTIDVADFIGKEVNNRSIKDFVKKCKNCTGEITLPYTGEKVNVTEEKISATSKKFLYAIEEAGKIYRHIEEKKGKDNFVVEISMDETDNPQTPSELLIILAAISFENIPIATIAPKFSGRFNKGVDYVGNVLEFGKEFEADIAVIKFAVKEFRLPENLKLSVHSGSDKFSIYPPISKALKKYNAGVHLKTAGTTWLEELIGLALSENSGLEIAKKIYQVAYNRFDELCVPYKTVIDINVKQLPSPNEVNSWEGWKYASTLRHDQQNENYNSNFRQLLHIAYKVAAELGNEFIDSLMKNEDIITQNVVENLYDRHIKKIFF
jgi:hypothetical protein